MPDHDKFEETFDETFTGFFKLFSKGFGAILGIIVISGIASVALVGTCIYLLIKHFG